MSPSAFGKAIERTLERYDALFTSSSYERGIVRGGLGWCLLRQGRLRQQQDAQQESQLANGYHGI